MAKRWTEEEIALLEEVYPKYGKSYSAKILNRSIGSIRTKAARLNLRSSLKGTHNIVSPLDYEFRLQNTDYINLEPYTRNTKKIKHKHLICGHEWNVSPNNLEKMVGCPNCSISGFKETAVTYLYLVYFPILELYKVGITVNWNKRKYDFGYKPVLLDLKRYDTGLLARLAEQDLLEELQPYLYNTQELKAGNTETFSWP